MNTKHIYRLQKTIGLGDQLVPMIDLATAVLKYHDAKQPEEMTKRKAKRIISQYLRKLGIIYSTDRKIEESGSCYVYIIQQSSSDRYIKIGMSSNPEKRIATMQTSSPYNLILIAKIVAKNRTHALYLEKGLHERFKKYKLKGEWFKEDALRCLNQNKL